MEKKKLLKNKIVDTLPVLYLETVILMVLGQFLGNFVLGIPVGIAYARNPEILNSAFLNTTLMYVIFWGIWAVALFWIGIRKRNRPILQAVGTKPQGNNWKYLLFGLVLGFALNGFCILIAWLHHDIVLTYDAIHPLWFVVVFLTVFIQSSAEALLFALLHLANNGVTVLSVLNIFLVGILFSLMVYYMDSLWCAFAVHTAWNFTQNILFGLPNSGINVPYSVFKLDAATARDSFAYNVGFGIEGTFFADIVLLAACVLLYLWGRKHGKKSMDVWAET